MGTFSFKSSGVTQAASTTSQLTVSPLPIGVRTPLSLGNDDLLTMTTVLSDQLADNLRNLILTNKGERLGFYDFGANLRPLTTELVSMDDFDAKAVAAIRTAVQRWMPYISLQSFLSQVDRSQTNRTAVINVIVTYDIPSLNVVGKVLQVNLYAI